MNPQRRRLLALPWVAGLSGCLAGEGRPLADSAEPAPPRWQATGQEPRVALVLSSGGLRGLAHLGVLQVLESQGLWPDLIVGSSIGALIGAAWAAGRDSGTLARLPLPGALDPWGSWWVGPETRRLALEQLVIDLIGARSIETLPRRFAAVATERNTGCLQVLGHGDVARAVAASAALPGAFAPVPLRGRLYVDGGLAAPLPVRVARALGATHTIAVDTCFHAEPEVPPGLLDSVFHAGMVMARHLSVPDRACADLLIEPILPPVPEITLERRDALIEAGARAANAHLDRLRRLFAGLEPQQAGPATWLPQFGCAVRA